MPQRDNGSAESMLAPNWYAIYTRHQHEKAIASILASKGFQILLPVYQVARRWRDRTKQLSLPLFPCYVFLQGELVRRVEVLMTPGVHSFVSIAGRPAVIPPEEINAVRRVVESGWQVEPHPFLKSGDWVRVIDGPLEGIEGVLVRKKNRTRLVLSVELLEKSAAVEVDACMVERVPPRRSPEITFGAIPRACKDFRAQLLRIS